MKNKTPSYEEIQSATETLGLIGIETRDEIKKKYLKLSKKYHPDMENGDMKLFQKINSDYKLLEQYMANYHFSFSKNEFFEQYPHAKEYKGDLMWGNKN